MAGKKVMGQREILIETKNLVKVYGEDEGRTYALNNVSLKIYSGEFLVILGESGSGKSTLLNMIGGIDNVDSGEIWVKGKNITEFSDYDLTMYRRHQVGFVFQFFNLINDLTVEQNITLAPGSRKDPNEIFRLLEMVGIRDKRKKYPRQLSGGQQQRVSIARALNKDSSLLLCDEPTGALDEASGRDVLRLLKNLNESEKKTIVLVTHAKEISRLADRVVRMRDARIIDIFKNKKAADVNEVSW